MQGEHSQAAGQYADALLQLAEAGGKSMEEELLSDLAGINKVISATPDLSILLRHPSISAEDRKALIVKLFEGQTNELTLRLLNLLADKRRLELLEYIEEEYRKLYRQKRNIVSATLESAEDLNDAQVAEIKTKLTKQLGNELEMDVVTDRSLIGGAILKLGDQVIDGSLRGKLQELQKAFLSV